MHLASSASSKKGGNGDWYEKSESHFTKIQLRSQLKARKLPLLSEFHLEKIVNMETPLAEMEEWTDVVQDMGLVAPAPAPKPKPEPKPAPKPAPAPAVNPWVTSK